MLYLSRKRSVVAALIVSLALAPRASLAKPVSLQQAQKAAETFLGTQGVRTGNRAGAPAAAAETTAAPVNYREIRDTDGTIVAYVADLEPRGFVAIAASTDMAPVVAYSFRGSFPPAGETKHPLARMLRADLSLRAAALAEDP